MLPVCRVETFLFVCLFVFIYCLVASRSAQGLSRGQYHSIDISDYVLA